MILFWSIVLFCFALSLGRVLGLPESVRKALLKQSEEERDSSSGCALLLLLLAAVLVTIF